jgi:aspartate racemase
MKTIGLIGGMSWESSAEYYRLINEAVKRDLGGLHSAQLLMYSVDFAEVEEMQRAGHWVEAGQVLADAARRLERGGADFLVLCTNTMHKVAADIEQTVDLPLLHIVDPTGEALRAAGISRVGLLGTRFTMVEDFYRQRLEQKFNLEVLIPDEADRELVHRVIYDELCLGDIRDASRRACRTIMARLVEQGAQGIILGCTEIGLLVSQVDSAVPLFDTTLLHAEAAAAAALRP